MVSGTPASPDNKAIRELRDAAVDLATQTRTLSTSADTANKRILWLTVASVVLATVQAAAAVIQIVWG